MDSHTPQQRHNNMAAIHGKDTKPEMVVRRWLWGHGYRYRLNHPRLPGKPDIVMRKYRTCIFVNGCFWHGHNVSLTPNPSPKGEGSDYIESSECCKIPKTNREFWVAKIRRNQERDTRVQRELAAMGWHSITIWECELKPKVREKTLESLAYTLNKIFLQDHSVRRYEIPEEEPLMAAEDVSVEYGNKATKKTL
ncbi:MAG: very short patch repair endonuclease [Prevotella sp.]|nr:very short patch repair endonuclease [Prevotella sp.]